MPKKIRKKGSKKNSAVKKTAVEEAAAKKTPVKKTAAKKTAAKKTVGKSKTNGSVAKCQKKFKQYKDPDKIDAKKVAESLKVNINTVRTQLWKYRKSLKKG